MRIPIEHNIVTTSDLQALFELLPGIDGHPRTIADIDVWLLASISGKWTGAQLAAAVLAISSTFQGFRVLPGHIGAQINADRERIRERWYCPDPPRHLATPEAEIGWRRRVAADFRERALLALATGAPLDDVPLVVDAEPEPGAVPGAPIRTLTQLVAAAPERHRPALAAATRKIEARRPRLDPEHRTAPGRRER